MSLWGNTATRAGTVRQRRWQPAEGAAAQRGTPDAAYGARTPAWQPTRPDGSTRWSDGVAAANLGLGAAALAPQFGHVPVNPIGAGLPATARPQASYGSAGRYVAGTVFWAAQTVPTSVPLGPLVSAQTLAALLGRMNVRAAVRVG